jgi:DNA repair photolyase
LAEKDIDQWKVEKIRQKDVDKGYRKRDGLIMFPSSHDITPTNFQACHTVLDKLLKAGNEVLIVSKPHFECIIKICRYFTEYKDKILFRFTITATDDEKLSFWEPGAPQYHERKQSLKIAWHLGFRTSVSVEPMLDPGCIDDLIAELDPLVTDTIWIGLMQHFQFIRIEDKAVEEAIEKIKDGQTVEKIRPIYEKHKDNPKIRWKDSIKKLLGLPLIDKPGLDI